MKRILIIGSNDIATASALRLFRSGFDVALVSLENPLDLYHFRNFSTVTIIGSKTISGVKALTFADFIYNLPEKTTINLLEFIEFSFKNRRVPVLTNKDCQIVNIESFDFIIVADADLFIKLNFGQMTNATVISCVENCPGLINYSIAVNSDFLGQVKYPFIDFPDATNKQDLKYEPVYSVKEGVFVSDKNIGDTVKKGEVIAHLNDQVVIAENEGYIDGQVRDGVIVPENAEIVRVRDYSKRSDHKILPSSSFAIAGGVLEAVLYHNKSNLNKLRKKEH
ncbi:MAG: hypothetical protein KDF60_14330 [Calditrichaeota bacterium]|nr:hypothetical protein [Calditrichota bacterium]